MSRARLYFRKTVTITGFAVALISFSWLFMACGLDNTPTVPAANTSKAATTAAGTTGAATTTASAVTTTATTTSAAATTASTTVAVATTSAATSSVATTSTASAAVTTTARATTIAVSDAATTTGNAANGKDLLRRGCQHCHSEIGTKTGPGGQPNLATSPNNGDLFYLRNIIRNGKTGGQFGVMPAHTSNDLNDKELEDIIAYIVSIRSDPLPANQGTAAVRTTAPAPTPTPVLPKGDVTRGETYFRQMACQHCHPSMGKAAGTRGQPNLATSTEAANAAYTRYRIRFGFTDESSSIGNMPAFKNDLTDQELEDLVSYVLSINTTK